MITCIQVPGSSPPPLELHVHYLVVRADGWSKRFQCIGRKVPEDSTWSDTNHYPSAGEVLIPVDP